MSISSSDQKRSSMIFKTLSPFAIGGTSGAVATCLIQPIDTLKVQIQVAS